VLWRDLVPARLRPRLRAVRETWRSRRRARALDLGALRRTTPIDARWGFGRGTPIDRVYIREFLERHRGDIRGRALEVKSPKYLKRYAAAVERVDILDIDPTNQQATIVADLQDAPSVPSGAFDCVILTQVLYVLYDVRAALRTVHRCLASGGVLLATVPGITRNASPEVEPTMDWWRFTALSARRLAEEAFGEGNVVVETFGNVLAATALLYGLAAQDLSPGEIATHDPAYEVTIGIRAVKRS
jgi:SAM-dependent methyltransferase